MTNHFILFDYRLVILAVLAIELMALGVAAFVQEEGGQLKVTYFTGRPVESGQTYLDLLVSGHLAQPVGSKDRVYVVGQPHCDVQKRALASGLMVRHGGLEEMTRAVELVPPLHVGPALLRLDQRVVGIQVTVIPLGSRDL